MSLPALTRFFLLVLVTSSGGISLACSEAVTPIPFLDGGASGSDAGIPRGGRDQLCIEGNCNNNTLLCVGDGSTPPAFFCRLSCDRFVTVDQCGEASRCAPREDGQGVCKPAQRLNETCSEANNTALCDDALVCAIVDNETGGTCRFECTPPPAAMPDAGPDGGAPPVNPCPAGEGDCRALDNAPDEGACLN